MKRLISKILVLGVVAGLTMPALAQGVVQLGTVAPDFPPGLFSDGNQYKLADLKGKVVVLYFFECTCPTARAAVPERAKVVNAMKGKGIKFLAIGPNMTIGQARAYQQQTGLPMPIFADSLGLMQARYNFQISLKNIWQTRVIGPTGLLEQIDMDLPVLDKVLQKTEVKPRYVQKDYDPRLRPAVDLLEFGQFAPGLNLLQPFAKSTNKTQSQSAKKLLDEWKTEAETWQAAAADMEGTDPLKAYDLYHKVVAAFPKDALGKTALAAAKKLATSKAITPELAARKACAAMVQNTAQANAASRPAFIQSCKALIKKYPGTPTAEKADELMQELGGKPPLKVVKSKAADKLVTAAALLHLEGKLKESQARLKEALDLEPTNPSYQEYAKELESALVQSRLDRYIQETPAQAEATIEELAKYLTKDAKTDRDKAWMIFLWIADRVSYDVEGFLSGNLGDNSAVTVLKRRKCVCQGYARLFEELAKSAGLEAVLVSGKAKSVRRGAVALEGHAWNAVKLDGEWRLLDATWGAGSVNSGTFIKRPRDYYHYYFLLPPEEFILTHFPNDSKWQVLETKVSQEEFERWQPKISPQLLQFGVALKMIRSHLDEPDFRGFPDTFTQKPGPKIQLLDVPLDKYLKSGKNYTFKIRAAHFKDMKLFQSGKAPQTFVKKGDFFEANVTVALGEVHISGNLLNGGSRYDTLLGYQGE